MGTVDIVRTKHIIPLAITHMYVHIYEAHPEMLLRSYRRLFRREGPLRTKRIRLDLHSITHTIAYTHLLDILVALCVMILSRRTRVA